VHLGLRWFGRGLQYVGLLALPAAIVLELMHELSLGRMLVMALTGCIAFYLGRMLEGYSLPPAE